jgi:hypothetical protein
MVCNGLAAETYETHLRKCKVVPLPSFSKEKSSTARLALLRTRLQHCSVDRTGRNNVYTSSLLPSANRWLEILECSQPSRPQPQVLGRPRQYALAQLSSSENHEWGSHEILGRIVIDDTSGFFKCGHLDGRRVIVDFKPFEPLPQDRQQMALAEPPPKILNRIHQLAALLHRRHSARTRLLPCEGFYRDARAPTFGFVFDVPTDRFHKPSTLGELLMVKSRAQRLALDSRAKLALMLSLALFQFHTVGWVHKSLRSSNVLFFPEKGADLSSVHYDEPWLVGFEYSREDPGFSKIPGSWTSQRTYIGILNSGASPPDVSTSLMTSTRWEWFCLRLDCGGQHLISKINISMKRITRIGLRYRSSLYKLLKTNCRSWLVEHIVKSL